MSYRITGLNPAPFRPLFALDDAALAERGARRVIADSPTGFPDRVSLRDAAVGEALLLMNYEHLPAANPYRSRHAIFVAESAPRAAEFVGEIPPALATRAISLRAFDARDEMVDADLADGAALAPLIERFFADPAVAYLHAHYARRGCYAARVDRG